MPLKRYRAKRNFSVTTEPKGRMERPGSQRKATGRFVIHKHAARSLHYDLRLEVEGVYRSWAVPKGPSLNPEEKRLAIEVEDHPLEYGEFEGVIPRGEYGAGAVIIWDRGSYLAENAKAQLLKGKLEFAVLGEKIRGTFTLVRLRPRGKAKNNWLLIKGRDEFVSERVDPVKDAPHSVVSGRTVEELDSGGRAALRRVS